MAVGFEDHRGGPPGGFLATWATEDSPGSRSILPLSRFWVLPCTDSIQTETFQQVVFPFVLNPSFPAAWF